MTATVAHSLAPEKRMPITADNISDVVVQVLAVVPVPHAVNFYPSFAGTTLTLQGVADVGPGYTATDTVTVANLSNLNANNAVNRIMQSIDAVLTDLKRQIVQHYIDNG